MSYAHTDGGALAQRLRDDLTAQRFEVWLDQNRQGAKGGAVWSLEIEDAIDNCQALVALLSRGSHVSTVCRGEHLRALRKGKLAIPILVQSDADRPVYLEAKQYLLFEGRHEEAFRELRPSLRDGAGAFLSGRYDRTPNETASPLPPNFIERPTELKKLRAAMIRDAADIGIAITVVRGLGGIGKTVLAQALCHDRSVQDAFSDGIIWVSIGRQPTESHWLAQIREISKAFGGGSRILACAIAGDGEEILAVEMAGAVHRLRLSPPGVR